MIAPARNGYAQRVGGSRLAAGARNVAKTVETPEGADIETSAESKRTGAQEESLLHEGGERLGNGLIAETEGLARRRSGEPLSSLANRSLRTDERLRAAVEAYRFTLEKLDRDKPGIKPGDVFDAPL